MLMKGKLFTQTTWSYRISLICFPLSVNLDDSKNTNHGVCTASPLVFLFATT